MSTYPCVYIICCKDWKCNGIPVVKIGKTIYPDNRMKQLKKHFNRNNLKFKYLFKTNVDDESRIETILHRKFKKFRYYDEASVELFNIDPKIILNELKELQNNGDGIILKNVK